MSRTLVPCRDLFYGARIALALACLFVLFAPGQAAAEKASSQTRAFEAAHLDAGGQHSCAILTTAVVRCWGEGDYGRLGYGNTTDIGDNEQPSSAGPVNLGAGRTATGIATGAVHTCGLLDNGGVRCWGYGGFGLLGYGNTNNIGDNETPGSVGPVSLGTGRTATAITAGDGHTCALLDDATVRCWGYGATGALGYGNTAHIGDTETPAAVPPVDLGPGRTARAITAGAAHTCALLDDGNVRCWGTGTNGRLGYGNTTTIGDNETPGSVGPVSLGAGRTAVAIAAGGAHTCALLDNGTVRCWGEGDFGRLGYANTTDIGDTELPSSVGTVNIGTGRTAVAITAGSLHTCAVLDNLTVRCWGEANNGRLGYSNTRDIGDGETPGSVGPVNIGTGRTAVAITAGGAHTCASLDNATVRCWGEADFGRLGYSSNKDIGDNEQPGSAGPVSLAGSVDITDNPPTAVNDSAVRSEDSGATAIAVLANDTDVDGGPKTIVSRTQGANGTVTITGGGSGLTYAPAANYCGPDSFTYTLNGGSTATVTMSVSCVDDAPVAVNDSAVVVGDSAPNTLNVRGNDTDVDGGLKTIQSVTQPVNGTVAITGGGATLTYQPDAAYCNNPPGNAPDTFTYTLNGGSIATVSMTVTCVDDPPVAVDDSATVDRDSGVNHIDVLDNDTDIDAGPMSVQSVSDPANGTAAITGGGTGVSYAPDPVYCNDPPGITPDTFTYTLNGGSTATVSVDVICVDQAPVAVNDTATIVRDSGANTIDVLANDTDADGGPKSVSSVSAASNGSVSIAPNGLSVSYTPSPGYCNDPPGTTPDTFNYTLTGGSTATVSVTVNCIDEPPTGVDDDASLDEDDGPTTIDVLANDANADGGPKTIEAATNPANGTVVVAGNKLSLAYEPDDDYCNTSSPQDTFEYTLNGGSTATVSVTVNCIDDLPVASSDSFVVTRDSGATSFDVLANDFDIDGGPGQVTSTSDPANGTVDIAPDGLTVNYLPDAGYCNDPPAAQDTFTYTLSGGSTAVVSVRVTCTDQPPVAVDDFQTVNEDSGATTFDVRANDDNFDGGSHVITSATDPANGTVQIAPDGLTLSYAPDPDYCNDSPAPDDTFDYTLNGGSIATVSVVVICVDEDPVAVADSASTTEDAGAATIDVLANDTDVDGGPRTIESASDPANGTVQVAPGELSLTYAPDPGYCNDGAAPDDTFTYTLNGGSTATVSVSVTCVDDLPTAVNDSRTVAEASGATAFDVLANDTDSDGGPKTIQSASDPANGTVVLTGGSAGAYTGLTYAPDPNYCNDGAAPDDTFTYTLNGGSSGTVSVAVTCVDELPTAVDDSDSVAEDSGVATVDVLANDTDTDGGPKTVQSASDPANGTVQVAPGGISVTYVPDPNYCNDSAADDTFTYTLNGGSVATVSMAVSCSDDAPSAVDDSPTGIADSSAYPIDVLANDTDIDGGPMTIASATDPANGTVVLTGGSPGAYTGLTYQPDTGYCNTSSPPDTFTYTLNGGSTATVAATVACAPTPDPPIIKPGEQRLRVHRLLVPKSAGAMIRKGIRVLASCELDCKIILDVTVRRSTANKLRLKGLQFAGGSGIAAAGEQRWVIAPLTSSAKRSLRTYGGGGRLRVKVQATSP